MFDLTIYRPRRHNKDLQSPTKSHLSAPLTDKTVQACRDAVTLIRNAGASAAQIVRIDNTHLVLILEFSTPQDADRVASEVGGPWMREYILPLLARGPERSVGEVIA